MNKCHLQIYVHIRVEANEQLFFYFFFKLSHIYSIIPRLYLTLSIPYRFQLWQSLLHLALSLVIHLGRQWLRNTGSLSCRLQIYSGKIQWRWLGRWRSISLIRIFFLQYVMARPYIFPHMFFFRNISINSYTRFCFLVSRSILSMWKTTLLCIFWISDFVALISYLLTWFIPSIKAKCVKTYTRMLVYWSLGYLCLKFGWKCGHSPWLQYSSHTRPSTGEGELTWNSYPPLSLIIYL